MNAHPAFAGTLAAFGGAAYAKPHKVMVPVDTFEVEMGVPGLMATDPENTRIVQPDDLTIQKAALHVLDKHAEEVETTVIKLLRGERLA